MSGRYDDIIDLPHYQSAKRPRMSNYDRAAQFSSFAALTGYEAAVAEAGRQTEVRRELSEEQKQLLDQSIQLLFEHIDERPEVCLTCFQADLRKSGGAYITITGRVRRIDGVKRQIILTDNRAVAIADIVQMEGPVLNKLSRDWF